MENRKVPVQILNMDLSDRVELVPGLVYRKSIGGKDLGVTFIWINKPKDPKQLEDLIPRHRHGEEMCFGIKGHGTIIIDGTPYPFKEGDAILIPAGVEHYGPPESDESIVLLVEYPPRPDLRFYFDDVTKTDV